VAKATSPAVVEQTARDEQRERRAAEALGQRPEEGRASQPCTAWSVTEKPWPTRGQQSFWITPAAAMPQTAARVAARSQPSNTMAATGV